METFGVFDKMCIESNAKLSSDWPALKQLLDNGVAKELQKEEIEKVAPMGGNAWVIKLGSGSASHLYNLSQSDPTGFGMCNLQSNHGSALDMQKTMEHLAIQQAKFLNGSLTHIKKELAGNPDIQLDVYEIAITGKSQPAVLSLSSTDTSSRSMRHSIVYQASKN